MDSPRIMAFSGYWAFNRMRNRRRFFESRMTARSSPFYLTIDGEQSPNPDSRVTLGETRDIFGLRRLKIDWRLADLDVQSVLMTCNLIAEELAKSEVGAFEFDPNIIPTANVARAMGGHHLGTTRMAREPAHGVVDENCQVHGVNNLHIASGSVFPTSGHANPTLTVVALAIRLADHLKSLTRRGTSSQRYQATEESKIPSR
jgi:choline dehydrogenase-like flavoprotein